MSVAKVTVDKGTRANPNRPDKHGRVRVTRDYAAVLRKVRRRQARRAWKAKRRREVLARRERA